MSAGHVLSQAFDLHCLSATRHALYAAILAAGLSPGRATTYLFAISEVLNNAVVHGGGGGRVTLSRQANQLVAVVEDRRPTPPFRVPAELPSPDSEGGRGLWLATQACTSLRMETGASGLRVVLTLQLTVLPGADDEDRQDRPVRRHPPPGRVADPDRPQELVLPPRLQAE